MFSFDSKVLDLPESQYCFRKPFVCLDKQFSLIRYLFFVKLRHFLLFFFSIALKIFLNRMNAIAKKQYLPPCKIIRDVNNNNQLLSFSTDTDFHSHCLSELYFYSAFSSNSIGASVKAFCIFDKKKITTENVDNNTKGGKVYTVLAQTIRSRCTYRGKKIVR